jgi:hypothetical protein
MTSRHFTLSSVARLPQSKQSPESDRGEKNATTGAAFSIPYHPREGCAQRPCGRMVWHDPWRCAMKLSGSIGCELHHHE